MKVERGRVVRLHYTIRDEAGATLESSRGQEPLHYLHGKGQLLPALEASIEGKEKGHVATVTVAPAEAYGERDPRGVVRAERASLPDGVEVAPGVELQAETPEGPLSFVVVAVEGDEVVLDANHPLAGKTLTFDVEVLGVRAATPEEIAHGHVHGPGGHHA
ncbi:MAG TPA: peptidylprolyl isomerase [Candidatus Polarisedimenticolaceae bacterium]|nr:peptidylprolyl isomerase [Candidatus Polarisedimenticolaceae bacterium]